LKHEEDLEKVRLRNISLKSLQKKLEKTLRQREQLAEGLHMIDFEQLKIENQTLNEKIEERNEELNKLKRKKTLTVQILTHIREKLKYVEECNKSLQGKLNDLEGFITTKRNSVTVKKLERDDLRTENKEYKAKQGFASSDLLLIDYEKRKYQTSEMEATLVELKNRYDLLARQLPLSNTGSQLFSSSMSGSGSQKHGLLMDNNSHNNTKMPGVQQNTGGRGTTPGANFGAAVMQLSRGGMKTTSADQKLPVSR
jgi:DNA repair exonuclease SbcCD ATPase subunit